MSMSESIFDTIFGIIIGLFFLAMLWNYVIGEEIKTFFADVLSLFKKKGE